jgi:cytochrome c556
MRFAPFVITASFVLLACGGSRSSQASNAQANIGANAAAASAAAIAAPLSGAAAAAVMHERHEGMETIGKANKSIHRALDASAPDLAAVRTGAAQIAGLSRKASGWFPTGTGPAAGKTGAKPEIWQNPQDFTAKLAAFQKSAAAFNAIAVGNDVGAIKAGFGNLAGTCKACHDKYRSEMKH